MVQMANYHIGSSEGRAAISPKEKPRRYMRGFQTGCTREGHPKGSLFERALRRWHATIGHSNFAAASFRQCLFTTHRYEVERAIDARPMERWRAAAGTCRWLSG